MLSQGAKQASRIKLRAEANLRVDVKLQVGKAAVATCGLSPPTTARRKFASRFNLGFFLSFDRLAAVSSLFTEPCSLFQVVHVSSLQPCTWAAHRSAHGAPGGRESAFHMTIYNMLQRRTPKSESITGYCE